jgi:hypothetical protein
MQKQEERQVIQIAGGIIIAFFILVFLPEVIRLLKFTLQIALIVGCFLLWYALVSGWFG